MTLANAFKNAKAWEQCKEAYVLVSEAQYNNQTYVAHFPVHND